MEEAVYTSDELWTIRKLLSRSNSHDKRRLREFIDSMTESCANGCQHWKGPMDSKERPYFDRDDGTRIYVAPLVLMLSGKVT